MNLVEQYKRLDTHVMRFADRMVSWAGMNPAEAERILDGIDDMSVFASRFQEAGQSWQRKAQAAKAQGRDVTAGDWFFLAFCCHRMADFYFSKDGSGRFDAYEAAVECFWAASATFTHRAEPISVRIDDRSFGGYLVMPADLSEPCPGVVVIYGADGNKEDHYCGTMLPAVRRGLAAMIVDGPGQGATLRRDGVPARPDTEVFASACLDVMRQDPRIDPSRIGIVGTSFGGYSGIRALACEPRFKAGLAISGLYDVVAGLWDPYPPIRPQLTYNVGARSQDEARDTLLRFTLDGLLESARQPLAIFHGGADPLIPPSQSQLIYDRWGGPKTLEIWPGGDHNLHNMLFAAGPEMWDWLASALTAE
jgi:dienelactone hydrolase